MWSSPKLDHASILDQIYSELINECRHIAPGARLSYPLRNRLDKLPIEQRQELVNRSSDTYGSPFFISCKRGNVEVVEYFITHCNADIELKGIYEVPDDRSSHYVTPLWCAAVAGKLDVVKCLVQHGANVNSCSDTGSSPVRSACFMTNLEVVKFLVENKADILRPNFNGGTCLINSVQSVPLCEYLLQNGADVNAQDVQLKTVIHYAIQEHRFETTKLLLKYGADPFIKNRYGDDALQTACLKGATQIFYHLIDNLDYSKERIADAYELLGSTFFDEHFDLHSTLEYWRKATEIRTKCNLRKPQTVPNIAYMNTKEFQTLEELDVVAQDFDATRMQSLLISERILGTTHKELIYRLMYRGATYADGLEYHRCVDLWKYALILRIRKDTLLHNETSFAAHALVRLFLDLNEKTHYDYRNELKYSDIYETINLIVDQFESCTNLLKVRPVFRKHLENFDKILKILTHLLYLLNENTVTLDQKQMTRGLVMRKIRKLAPRNANGDTLLHLVVSKANTMKSSTLRQEEMLVSVFPDYNLCKLLLECGFYVDSTNFSLETPLHIVSMYQNYNPKIIDLLLSYGAHIDQKDLTGNQPCKRLASRSAINPVNYLTLKCLAACKIRAFNIPYVGVVPVFMEEFIGLH